MHIQLVRSVTSTWDRNAYSQRIFNMSEKNTMDVSHCYDFIFNHHKRKYTSHKGQEKKKTKKNIIRVVDR